MREILFRGKRIDNGEWVEGYLFLITKHSVQQKSLIPCIQVIYPNNLNHISYEVIPESVGQFTGRQDSSKIGNEVFEGDIIENCDTKLLEVVYWNEDESAWFCKYTDGNRTVSLSDSLGNLNEVIGNIHDNPELLK